MPCVIHVKSPSLHCFGLGSTRMRFDKRNKYRRCISFGTCSVPVCFHSEVRTTQVVPPCRALIPPWGLPRPDCRFFTLVNVNGRYGFTWVAVCDAMQKLLDISSSYRRRTPTQECLAAYEGRRIEGSCSDWLCITIFSTEKCDLERNEGRGSSSSEGFHHIWKSELVSGRLILSEGFEVKKIFDYFSHAV